MVVAKTDVITRIVYKLVLRTGSGERVIDVGRTHNTARRRMRNKRDHYNAWLKGYVRPSGRKKAGKCGFYGEIKKILGEERWTVLSLPQVRMEVVLEEEMDDYHADLMEGFFQKVIYPECHNVMIGDGLHKAGGMNKSHFGCVYWDKRGKKFRAQYTLPKCASAKRDSRGNRKKIKVSERLDTIQEAHAFIIKKWAELKNEPNYVGYRPPKTLAHYKQYLANKYDELSALTRFSSLNQSICWELVASC